MVDRVWFFKTGSLSSRTSLSIIAYKYAYYFSKAVSFRAFKIRISLG